MIKNKAAFKYMAALLLFGSNGIVASHISLSSHEIVFTRTLIGSLFLVLIFIFTRLKAQFWQDKQHFLHLVISGVAMGISWMFLFVQIVGAVLILGGAGYGELFRQQPLSVVPEK